MHGRTDKQAKEIKELEEGSGITEIEPPALPSQASTVKTRKCFTADLRTQHITHSDHKTTDLGVGVPLPTMLVNGSQHLTKAVRTIGPQSHPPEVNLSYSGAHRPSGALVGIALPQGPSPSPSPLHPFQRG